MAVDCVHKYAQGDRVILPTNYATGVQIIEGIKCISTYWWYKCRGSDGQVQNFLVKWVDESAEAVVVPTSFLKLKRIGI